MRQSIGGSHKGGQNIKVEAVNENDVENKTDYQLPDGATYTG